jgi:NADH-quinone oxidoreductase subunit N
VAGFLGFVPKLAGLIGIFKLVALTGYWTVGDTAVYWLFWIVSVASMTVGNVLALRQTNIKRMLAYSSVAHAGYLLVALVSANDAGKGAMLFYLLAYAVANIGAFGVIGLLGTSERSADRVTDFAGLSSRHPALAALMTVFLLSLGGFPPLGGFIAKWYVFTAAMQAGHVWLAIIGVLTSVVSVFFYLRVVVMMYMTPGDAATELPPVPRIAGAALVLSAVLVLYLGVLPARVLDWAAASIGTIF